MLRVRATAMKIEIRSLFSWTLHFLYREECQVDVQLLSCVRLRPHELQHTRLPCPSLISWSLLKLKFIESVMPSNHLILCHPLLLPSIFPNFRIFSNELVLCIRWPKYWSFSFSISLSNEYLDWFPLRFTDLKLGPIKFWLWPWATCLSPVSLCFLICK